MVKFFGHWPRDMYVQICVLFYGKTINALCMCNTVFRHEQSEDKCVRKQYRSKNIIVSDVSNFERVTNNIGRCR